VRRHLVHLHRFRRVLRHLLLRMGKFGYRCAESGIKALDDTKLVEYIQEIDCSANPELDSLSVKIATCKSLEKLIGVGCCIKSIPIELAAAKDTLVEINLSSNMISELQPGLGALAALTSVDLSMNQLTAVSAEVLAGWPKLEFLYLNCNKLKSVGSLAPCTSLYELRLQDNQLESLPTMGEHPELEIVDASANYLTEAPAGAFEKCPALTSITLLPAKEAAPPAPAAPASAPAPAPAVAVEAVGLDLGKVVSDAADAVVRILTNRGGAPAPADPPADAPPAAAPAAPPLTSILEDEAPPRKVEAAPAPAPAAAVASEPAAKPDSVPKPDVVPKPDSVPKPDAGGCCLVM